MAGTRFDAIVLAAVMAVHLFSVGTLVFADNVPCPERCNLSHGECTQSGTCRCQPGWEGENCNRCTRAPGCMYGTCHQPWQCNCKPGWGGRRCDKDLNICERNRPCQNQGTCINTRDGEYYCVCKVGFYGTKCENYRPGGMPDYQPTGDPPATTIPTTTQASKQCQHGGKCKIYSLTGHGCDRCICFPGYVGRHCEVNVNECLMRPCANGGKCFDLSNDFFCECQRGYTGRYCADDVDECAINPDMCYNGGACRNTYGSYECACSDGFDGKRCENERPRPDRVAPGRPVMPGIVRVTTAYSEATTAKVEMTTAEAPRRPRIVKNPGAEVKMTRITHEVKISSVNGDISSDNAILIRSEGDADSGDASANTVQAMMFVFMALAIVILAAILALVWFRCFRNQANAGDTASKNRDKLSDPEAHPKSSSIPSVDKAIRDNRGSATVVATDSIDNVDEASMQVQPCLSSGRGGTIVCTEPQFTRDCPSPPPPYALSAVGPRRGRAPPRSGYYVALPPARQDFSRSRKSPSAASHAVTSHDPEETSSLLDADSPTLSHKIVV